MKWRVGMSGLWRGFRKPVGFTAFRGSNPLPSATWDEKRQDEDPSPGKGDGMKYLVPLGKSSTLR